jgi:hypothetical protein
MGFDYDGLKALARRLRRPLHSLIVLSDDNDPFFASRPGKRLDSAEWFARLWDELEIPHGSHLRRVHYLMVSTPGIMLPDGRSPYLNTEKCWKDLVNAGRDARYLELVDPEAFVDRRAPEPLIYEPEDVATPRAALSMPCLQVAGRTAGIRSRRRSRFFLPAKRLPDAETAVGLAPPAQNRRAIRDRALVREEHHE